MNAKKSTTNNSKRSNLWTAIIYPNDSCPNDFISIIQSWHIPCLLSPLHDKDLNADETEKKQHMHLMLYFGNGANKSIEQVKYYIDQLNGTNPFIVNSRDAMIRYFIHRDNPEKHQYSRDELICLNGFDIGQAFESYSNDSLIYSRIEQLIKDEKIYNFWVLYSLLQKYNMQIELDFLRRHTMFFRELINARFQLLKNYKNIDDI